MGDLVKIKVDLEYTHKIVPDPLERSRKEWLHHPRSIVKVGHPVRQFCRLAQRKSLHNLIQRLGFILEAKASHSRLCNLQVSKAISLYCSLEEKISMYCNTLSERVAVKE